MKNQFDVKIPPIIYLMAVLIGVVLFTLFGETLTGVKPNLIWMAWLTGFLFACGALMVGAQHHNSD